MPIKRIARELGVSQGSVHAWTRDIELTDAQLAVEQIERHWLQLLQLPRNCLRKHTLNHMPTSSSGRVRNKLPYGVCRLDVHSTRAIQHIYGAIQEYCGFEEPSWLD